MIARRSVPAARVFLSAAGARRGIREARRNCA